ncbi:Cohesin domain-containing protein [Candidatus Methanophagaceae archaeon]|nr:Cohesin domain-containing protein [Methanophagales archaeon]
MIMYPKVLKVVLVAAIALSILVSASADPSADSFGVDDASGYNNASVAVPVSVNITEVKDGPVPSLIFDISYDNSVINVTDVQNGTLTSDWDTPAYCNHEGGTKVAIVYDSVDEHAIQNVSTGSVVVLNFSVIGEAGDTSEMNLSNIQLAEGSPDYQIGTAPAKNGTFTVQLSDETPGKITGQIKTITGIAMAGVTVTLTANDSSVVLETTTTNETGYFDLTMVEAAEYGLYFSKLRYWDNSTLVTVQSGGTKTVNSVLFRKGDLNDNERSADAGDVTMMLRASVYRLTPDWRYDLNNDGGLADAGDVTMMLRASVYKLELL